ncbi:hypothetical protein [Streptomyces sp. AC555_RSS877]|uniref:hypothetical protein n=1 Tax=Streptomyces sp. AC555_RSS877 TaxID=2823688 RepID=UPI001C269B3B|nr:hypothetical protein [Streptomyces sp. AC555_RSS877]
MSVETVVTLASAAAAVIAILFYVIRRALKEAETLLLALVPVIHALGKVRTAWQQTRRIQEGDAEREEGPRALP